MFTPWALPCTAALPGSFRQIRGTDPWGYHEKAVGAGVPYPANVENAIMKALAVKTEDRFPNMEASSGH